MQAYAKHQNFNILFYHEIGVYIISYLITKGFGGLPVGVVVGAVMETVGYWHSVMVFDELFTGMLEGYGRIT